MMTGKRTISTRMMNLINTHETCEANILFNPFRPLRRHSDILWAQCCNHDLLHLHSMGVQIPCEVSFFNALFYRFGNGTLLFLGCRRCQNLPVPYPAEGHILFDDPASIVPVDDMRHKLRFRGIAAEKLFVQRNFITVNLLSPRVDYKRLDVRDVHLNRSVQFRLRPSE